jgi:hypothetical protein
MAVRTLTLVHLSTLITFTHSFYQPAYPLRGIYSHGPAVNACINTERFISLLSTRHLKSIGTALQSKSELQVEDDSSTLYDILGIAWGASQKDVRKAYGDLAKKYHPDVTGNDEASKQYFLLVKDAYEVLSDDVLRARYNNVLMSQGYTPPKGSVSRGQELGMSEWQFFLVVLLVNPFYLFLLGPFFGFKVEDVKSFLNLN